MLSNEEVWEIRKRIHHIRRIWKEKGNTRVEDGDTIVKDFEKLLVDREERIATLDDKSEPEELWASMDRSGHIDINPLNEKPRWAGKEEGGCDHFIRPAYGKVAHGSDLTVPGLRPGMLCKAKKVGEHEYEIISVEECHRQIEVEWYAGWCAGWFTRIPYLPNTHIQITCPFEEKKEEKRVRWAEPPYWDKCQQNCCPQCGCKTQPSDNFCRNCGECLKGDC